MIDLPDGATTSAGQPAEQPDFVFIDKVQRPLRLMRSRQRLLVPRSGAGLIMHEDDGAEFVAINESRTLPPSLRRTMKDGYIERAHNAYRMTDRINSPERGRLRHRIDMIV